LAPTAAGIIAAICLPAWGANGLTAVGAGIRHSTEGMYGNCARIGPGYASGLNSKRDVANVAGRDPYKAERIDLLECGLFDGGGGTSEVECPVQGYTYCAVTHNDGAGNMAMVGVVLDTTPPICQLTGKRDAPWSQIDVMVRDPGTGIRSIEFRQGVENAVLQQYESLDQGGMIVITATKEDPNQPARIKPFYATDGAQNTILCGPYSF
jgi:hypothetical protein